MTTELFESPAFSEIGPTATRGTNLEDSGIAIGETAAVFQEWAKKDLSLALWRRELPADIKARLENQDLEKIKGWRRTLDGTADGRAIAEAVAGCGLGDPATEAFLASDMPLLRRIFAAATSATQLEARLEIVRTDACRRFHVDNYPARLAVTYVGPGTVWVPAPHGEQALVEQEDYSGPAPEIPAFSVGLFAGEAAGRTGLVHRSPRIAGTGRMRLFFCVNAALS